MSSYAVNALVDNGLETGSGGRQQKAAHAAVKKSDGDIEYLAVKQRNVLDGVGPPPGVLGCSIAPEFQFLWGSLNAHDGWPKATFNNGNDHSVVTRLSLGKTTFLFPGDLEEDIQEDVIAELCEPGQACPLDVDFYHVAHHGSHNGTTTELLEAMTPRAAVISMGPFSRPGSFTARAFGHPRATIIRELVDPQTGVSGNRDQPTAEMVANRAANSHSSGPQFTKTTISKAVYATGWQADGTLVFVIKANGTFSVIHHAK